MDTAWIQVFVLTIAECVAPAGKTVCQEQLTEIDFLSQGDCEAALEQLIAAKNADERVILNVDETRCSSTARKREVWASMEGINEAFAGSPGFQPATVAEAEADFQQVAHEERLAAVPECAPDAQVYPCRQGPIIVEEPPSREVEVWRLEPDGED